MSSWIARIVPLIVAAFPTLALAQPMPLQDQLIQSHEAGALPGLHGVIVDLAEERLAEAYFAGEDERWGQAIGPVEHSAQTLHDLRSVSKSVVGLLYGIALDDGLVPGLDEGLYAQFPQYADLADDPDRGRIKIHHVLSMQMGLEWDESLPYTDPRNSEIAMEQAPDRLRFVLEQPIREAPGQSWIYSGGAVALIGALIAEGTGKSLDSFANERLFEPLGIAEFEWVGGRDGVPSAASGLRLTLPDLTKIGHLIAGSGTYDGQQIVSKDWLDKSFEPQVVLNEFTRYGLLWYLTGPEDRVVVFGSGNGGQRLTVQPSVGLVVASYSGQYNNPESWQTPLKLVLEFAVPEARRLLGR